MGVIPLMLSALDAVVRLHQRNASPSIDGVHPSLLGQTRGVRHRGGDRLKDNRTGFSKNPRLPGNRGFFAFRMGRRILFGPKLKH